MRNKLKVEETNKNRNATYVRKERKNFKNLPNTLFPRENEKKNKQSRNNKRHFLKNANIFTRHCACDI